MVSGRASRKDVFVSQSPLSPLQFCLPEGFFCQLIIVGRKDWSSPFYAAVLRIRICKGPWRSGSQSASNSKVGSASKSKLEPCRTVDVHNGFAEAQNGAVEGLWTSGLQNSDPDSHQSERGNRIRMRIRVFRICNTAMQYHSPLCVAYRSPYITGIGSYSLVITCLAYWRLGPVSSSHKLSLTTHIKGGIRNEKPRKFEG